METYEDNGSPTGGDVQELYGSRHLGADDLGDRKIKAEILKVSVGDLRQQNGEMRRKAIVHFDGLDKGLPLNTTNYGRLRAALGKDPRRWIGASVGLFTEPTQVAGRPTRGIRLQVLAPVARA